MVTFLRLGPQNCLIFKGKVYDLQASPQSHLLGERIGSPEGLGRSPTETPICAPHSQLCPSPILGPGLCWRISELDCLRPSPPPQSPPAAGHTPWPGLPGLPQPVTLQPIHSPLCRRPPNPSVLPRLLVHSWPSLTPTDTLATL